MNTSIEIIQSQHIDQTISNDKYYYIICILYIHIATTHPFTPLTNGTFCIKNNVQKYKMLNLTVIIET